MTNDPRAALARAKTNSGEVPRIQVHDTDGAAERAREAGAVETVIHPAGMTRMSHRAIQLLERQLPD
jgi:hypothetical protein